MAPARCSYLWPALVLLASTATAADSQQAALESITASELHDHVATLADDALEGRLVGTRGGRAAGQYIVQQLRPLDVAPAGNDGMFVDCDEGGRSILVLWPGSDPELRDEVIVVGAHYDHVGDGRKGHAAGAVGQIYNGADDNASGVAALLELVEAVAEHRIDTRRSILFAFWDGEEMGMLGSKQWFKQPTVPSDEVRLAINIDMIGRLRDGRLEVLGTRTGYGLRRLLSGHVRDPLWLDFPWDLKPNSDHWPFVEHNIPIAMFHTGLHNDYHLPGDDSEKINTAGLETVGRYLLATVVKIANSDWLPEYRPTGRYETLATQRRMQPKATASKTAQSAFPTSKDGSPPRLGLAWRTDDAEPGSVYVTHVAAGSPAAAAGIAVDDRIYAVNGEAFADSHAFRETITALFDSDDAEIELLVESRGRLRTATIRWRPTALAAKSST
jgi:hypothetical protein